MRSSREALQKYGAVIGVTLTTIGIAIAGWIYFSAGENSHGKSSTRNSTTQFIEATTDVAPTDSTHKHEFTYSQRCCQGELIDGVVMFKNVPEHISWIQCMIKDVQIIENPLSVVVENDEVTFSIVDGDFTHLTGFRIGDSIQVTFDLGTFEYAEFVSGKTAYIGVSSDGRLFDVLYPGEGKHTDISEQ